MKKIKTYAIFALLIVVIGFLVWDGCNSRKQLTDFENQMAEYDVKQQGFKVTINKQGKKIARQRQIILTKEQAIQQGLIANTELKKIKSQVKIITRTKIEKEFIPFIEPDTFDPDIFDDVKDNVISVPKPFSTLNEWYWMGGRIVKKGLEIDSIKFVNQMTITIGEKRLKGIKNLFKRKIPIVEVFNDNPHVKIQGLQNIIIAKKPKKFYQTTLFKIGVGVVIGTYATIQIGKTTN